MKHISATRKEPKLKKEFLQEIKKAEEELRQGKGLSTSQLLKELKEDL